MLQMLAPLFANPNPKIFGETIISNSAKIGQLDLIKILAPLNTNNLKAADTNGHEWFKGFTPIHHAAYFGHIEIIKILVPLMANPNLETAGYLKQTPV